LTENASIEISGLFAGYAGSAAVRDVTLQVAPGEVVAMVGPNGAGKTTVMHSLAGLLPVMQGSVRVMGEVVKAGRPYRVARRGLAFVPDDRSLFYGLTVRENLRMGSRGRRKDNLDAVLDYFPALQNLLGRRAGLLSGGEQQMLALGRAMASKPRVLAVDEMSLGLAPNIVTRLLPVLRRIADENGTAVLVVEQHVHLVLSIADRAYVLSHGDMTFAGSAQQLQAQPEILRESYLGAQKKRDTEG
jgi:branched-chain amino acid transport system ATP-binding protein